MGIYKTDEIERHEHPIELFFDEDNNLRQTDLTLDDSRSAFDKVVDKRGFVDRVMAECSDEQHVKLGLVADLLRHQVADMPEDQTFSATFARGYTLRGHMKAIQNPRNRVLDYVLDEFTNTKKNESGKGYHVEVKVDSFNEFPTVVANFLTKTGDDKQNSFVNRLVAGISAKETKAARQRAGLSALARVLSSHDSQALGNQISDALEFRTTVLELMDSKQPHKTFLGKSFKPALFAQFNDIFCDLVDKNESKWDGMVSALVANASVDELCHLTRHRVFEHMQPAVKVQGHPVEQLVAAVNGAIDCRKQAQQLMSHENPAQYMLSEAFKPELFAEYESVFLQEIGECWDEFINVLIESSSRDVLNQLVNNRIFERMRSAETDEEHPVRVLEERVNKKLTMTSHQNPGHNRHSMYGGRSLAAETVGTKPGPNGFCGGKLDTCVLF